MKKILKARYSGFLALALASFGWLAATTVAQAQYSDRYRRGTLSNASYERMRGWAHELDQVAEHASEQAQAQQGGYRGFGRDRKFLQSIDHFADRARRFHERMDSYRTRPWNVDDEIDHLLRDARNVQYRLRRARFVDEHTAADWERVIQLLNQMSSEYRTGFSQYGSRPSDTHPYGYPSGTAPNPHGEGRYDDRYGYGRSGDVRQLARELEDRAMRASDLAQRYSYGYSASLRHFSEQARYFRDQVESAGLSGSELRSQVNHLLEDAQAAQDEIRRTRASSDLASEWDRVVQVLNRLRDLAV